MKLSEMIENLEAIKSKHGDLNVEFSSIQTKHSNNPFLVTTYFDFYIVVDEAAAKENGDVACVNIIGKNENIDMPRKFTKHSLIHTD